MERFFRSLEHAWSGAGQTRVVSRSIYEFNVDDRVLRITDNDFIFTSRNQVEIPDALYTGVIVLKNIRRTATNIRSSVVVPPDTFSEHTAFQGVQAPGIGVLTVPNNPEGLLAVEMSVDLENAFLPGAKYHIQLTYDIPLNLRNKVLMFSGAIQPADYDGVRRLFGAELAEKYLAIRIVSRKNVEAYFYHPLLMDYSPNPSRCEEKGDVFEVLDVLRSEMKDWHRAHYFSVFALLEPGQRD